MDTMAAAFASEGVSALNEIKSDEFIHTEISDTEIGTLRNMITTQAGGDILSGGFDLHKA